MAILACGLEGQNLSLNSFGDYNNTVNVDQANTFHLSRGFWQSQLELSCWPQAEIAQNNQHFRFRLVSPQ